MLPTPLIMKNSRGKIVIERQLRKPSNLPLTPKKHKLGQ